MEYNKPTTLQLIMAMPIMKSIQDLPFNKNDEGTESAEIDEGTMIESSAKFLSYVMDLNAIMLAGDETLYYSKTKPSLMDQYKIQSASISYDEAMELVDFFSKQLQEFFSSSKKLTAGTRKKTAK